MDKLFLRDVGADVGHGGLDDLVEGFPAVAFEHLHPLVELGAGEVDVRLHALAEGPVLVVVVLPELADHSERRSEELVHALVHDLPACGGRVDEAIEEEDAVADVTALVAGDVPDAFDDTERDFLLRTLTLFQAGEEGVTSDLLPLIMVIADEGRLEEEIFLTSFLWEEAKHVEFFRRWLDEVAQATGDLDGYLTPSYRHLFLTELPQALGALKTDKSTEAQIRASVTYNMIIEGVLAETGYHGFRQSLESNGKLPGLLDGIRYTAKDESRHIRYGVYLLNRLINASPQGWEVMNQRMTTYIDYASTQFDKRMRVLERDRGKSLAEIASAAVADLVEEEVALPVG